jgi:hypothetical protein
VQVDNLLGDIGNYWLYLDISAEAIAQKNPATTMLASLRHEPHASGISQNKR